MRMLEKFPHLRPKGATLVDISDTARWFYEEYKFKTGPRDDFAALCLPWDSAWFEFDLPKRIDFADVDYNDPMMVHVKRIGVIANSRQLESDESFFGVEDHPGSGSQAVSVIHFTAYIALNHRIASLVFDRWLFVDTSGRCVAADGRCTYPELTENEDLAGDAFFLAVMFAICLLNCKNIELVNQPVSKKVMRRQERNGGRLTYKTLIVEPLKKQIRNEQHGEKTDIHRALHICRGHFATYSEERPLFGKHAGTFWIPMHTKGSRKHGEVKKDYKVKEPVMPTRWTVADGDAADWYEMGQPRISSGEMDAGAFHQSGVRE